MSDYCICPGCENLIKNEEIKLNNNCCPDCGLSYDDKEKVEDLKRGYICPKCGCVYGNVKYRNNSGKCRFCNVTLVKIDIDTTDLYDIIFADCGESKTMAKAAANHYGNSQFSENAYDERHMIQKEEAQQRELQKLQHQSSHIKPKPQVTCPYCHSTNTKKITTMDRIGSNIMFGIFSKKHGKEWHCNECGSYF